MKKHSFITRQPFCIFLLRILFFCNILGNSKFWDILDFGVLLRFLQYAMHFMNFYCKQVISYQKNICHHFISSYVYALEDKFWSSTYIMTVLLLSVRGGSADKDT